LRMNTGFLLRKPREPFWYDAGWDTVVNIVTRVWFGHTRTLRYPAGARFVFPWRSDRRGPNQTHVHLEPAVKRPGREAYSPSPSSTEVKNECRGTSTPPHAFIACTGATVFTFTYL
jgi:hypothetical protein